MKPYTPRGKVKLLLEAMAAAPEKSEWNVPEVARVMQVGTGEVMAHVLYALKHKAIYRGKRNGRVLFSTQPFPQGVALKNNNMGAAIGKPAVAWEPGDDVRVPRVDPTWKPPVMQAPRAGSAR